MNVLIIKTGLTETFDNSAFLSEIVSLGDVLRSTVLLHLFPGDNVTWFTSKEAMPLIKNVSQINATIDNFDSIEGAHFDLIINLERTLAVLSNLKKVTFEKMLGFVDSNEIDGAYLSCHGQNIISLSSWLNEANVKNTNWSEKLFLIMGEKWSGQNYLISQATNKSKSQVELGLNWKVGAKWPSKTWSFENWTFLSKKLDGTFSYSWQEGFNNLDDYINWIESCNTLVTHDSLGLHIAIALNKKVVALFGPTSKSEITFGKQAKVLSMGHDSQFSCMPCYKENCDQKTHCMNEIKVDDVFKAISYLVGKSNE